MNVYTRDRERLRGAERELIAAARAIAVRDRWLRAPELAEIAETVRAHAERALDTLAQHSERRTP